MMQSDRSLEFLNEAHSYQRYLRHHSSSPRRVCHDHRREMTSRPKPTSSGRHEMSSQLNSHTMGSRERGTDVNCSYDRRRLMMLDSATTQPGGGTMDSFGFPPYKALYNFAGPPEVFNDGNSKKNTKGSGSSGGSGSRRRHNGAGTEARNTVRQPDLDVPWQLREAFSDPVCSYFDFLGTKHFWFLVQFSARVTFIGILIPALIIAFHHHSKEFISSVYTLPAVIIGTDIYVGGSAVFLTHFLKAGCIWLPLATACASLDLRRNFVVWLVVYFILIFLIACLTRGVTQRLCLLLLNISLVGQLNGYTELLFPSYLLLNWLIGLMFGFAATLLPYPVLATRSAHSIIRRLFTNAATAFRGLSTCFWAVSNTERSMGMVRIRHVTRSLDILLNKVEEVEKLALYEFLFFESYERRRVRLEKAELLDKLRLNLRSMTRVIDIVQDNAHIIDNSSRCIQFGASLSRSMEGISRAVEELLEGIAGARSRRDLLGLGPLFEACGCSIKRLQEEFSVASRRIFYEKRHTAMEEFVPLMTFFVFSVVNFWSALDEFHHKVRTEGASPTRIPLRRVWDAIKRPFANTITFLKQLVLTRGEAEVRVLVEAGKVSVAMLIALLFFYYVEPELLLLSGPTIIAFLSGVNPVHAVQGSLARLTGTLFGSVIGFFAASLCKTKVDFIISLCAITAVLTFFRTGQKFGLVCMYANFIAVPALSIEASIKAGTIISRIQQNSFAIMIYCLIAVLVFPISPGKLLMKKRMEILQTIADIITDMMDFYWEPLQNEPRGLDSHDGGFFQHNGAFATLHADEEREGKSTTRESGTSAHPVGIVPTFIMVPEPDSRVSNLFDKVWHLRREMAHTASIMPFAADERGIKPFVYPQKACEAAHTALYRIFALVYTMVCSWRLMRDKGYFTPEVRRILRYVYPVTRDIQQSLQRFVNLLSFYVAHPSSSLGSELTKCLLQFRALVGELSRRKHDAILAIITEAVRRQRQREDESRHMHFDGSSGHHDGGGGTSPIARVFLTTVGHADNATPAWERHRCWKNGDPLETIRSEGTSSSRHAGRDGRGTSADTGNRTPSSPCNAPDDFLEATGKRRTICRVLTAAEEVRNEPATGNAVSHTREPQQQHQQERQQPSANGSVRFPSFNGSLDTLGSDGNGGSPLQDSVHFSESFTIPITVYDAEGIHSITLSLDMMGRELKNALLAFEDMVQLKTY